MNHRIIAAAFVAVASFAGPAAADDIAVGIAPATHELESGRWGFAPELLAHTYVPLDERGIFLRPGGRIAVRGLVQENMATSLRLEERDVAVLAELGIVRDGRVVPSATLLAGMTHRWISVGAQGVDTSMSRVAGTEWLPVIGGQLGVGMPLHRRLLIEPFVRYEITVTDARTHLRWGVEASVSFGD